MRVSLLAAVDLFFAGLCTSSLSRSVLSLSRAFSLCLGVCLSFLLFCLPFCVRLSVSLNYNIYIPTANAEFWDTKRKECATILLKVR